MSPVHTDVRRGGTPRAPPPPRGEGEESFTPTRTSGDGRPLAYPRPFGGEGEEVLTSSARRTIRSIASGRPRRAPGPTGNARRPDRRRTSSPRRDPSRPETSGTTA